MTMEKLALSPTETAEALHLSRSSVYQLLKRADFPSFKVGNRTLIPVEPLRRWVEKQTEDQGA